ncbi:ankyrin, partial [Aspergillus ellipticus CBS 707.79]
KLLLERGANVNHAERETGSTPLLRARDGPSDDIVDLLLMYGAKVNAVNKNKDTPLCLAAARGRERVVESLLENRANVHLVGAGLPPLMWAVMSGNVSVVRQVFRAGADVNGKGNAGINSLRMAEVLGHTEIVELL